MLKRLDEHEADLAGAQLPIGQAAFPAPFVSGLEFNAPARGMWNIVHTGMLIPESHQIFVCARGCLRGVVLTAAEMDASDRMSWVDISEKDLVTGALEQNVIDGTAEILGKLLLRPRAVLVFFSCVQLFAGIDIAMIFRKLSAMFPDVEFLDCYMHPTMRKSGPTPDQMMRNRLYGLLKKVPQEARSVNILGNDRATDESSEIMQMLSGYTVRDITSCRTWSEYQEMAKASLNIVYLPVALLSAQEYERRMGTPYVYLPLAYDSVEIWAQWKTLATRLSVPLPDKQVEAQAEECLAHARKVIGDIPIEIDYTATPRPLALARLLLSHKFNVVKVYADVFQAEEQADFQWLKRSFPGLMLQATVHHKMRFCGRGQENRLSKVLAIGQKAAWFAGTPYFVNMVAGGGHVGFDGVGRLADLLVEACEHQKDLEHVIQHKGLGLPCVR